MKRAGTEEQKNLRREQILEYAAQLLGEKPFHALTLAEVAAGLGLVKGTLYRYFPTKEHLVLEVLEGELEKWMVQLDADLSSLQDRSLPTLAQHLARSLGGRPLLVSLFSIVHVVLEDALDQDRLLNFKLKILSIFQQAAQVLEHRYALLQNRGQGAVMVFYQLAIGVGHVAYRGPRGENILKDPRLGVFRVNFQEELARSLTWALEGLARPGS